MKTLRYGGRISGTALAGAVFGAVVGAFAPPLPANAQADGGLSMPVPGSAQGYYGLSYEDRARLDALRRSQDEQDAKARAERRAWRDKLLRAAPLPDERNPLLGRWRVEKSAQPRGKDELSQLMGMITNPMGAACSVLFGDGITEFAPRSWASIDRSGNDSLGPIAYRGVDRNVVAAIPDKGVEMLVFEIAGPNRLVYTEGCALVRVGGPAVAAAPAGQTFAPAAPPPARGPTPGSPSAGLQTSDLQVAAVAPPRAAGGRPSSEVCARTLLDQLGKVGVNQVRQVAESRFKESIDGKVPNSQNLRIDARGSACDDPRVLAVLYDFDAAGTLQSMTWVWQRQAGAAPAPIFVERVKTLSALHALPAPQSDGRLQADTALGRLVLQDMPERQLLLEAYRALR